MKGGLGLFLGRVGGVAGALVLGQVVLGLTFVVGARTMTPATLGLIATLAAIGQVAATVVDFGLINYLVRETASGRITSAHARALTAAKRPWALAVLLVVGGASSFLFAPNPVAGLLLTFVGAGVWEAQNANGLLRAQERFGKASTGQILGRVGGLVAVVVLALVGAGDAALAAAIPLSFLLEAVLDRVFLGRAGTRRREGSGEIVAAHRESVGFGLANLAVSAQQLDTPLATAGGGAYEGGLYAAGGRLIGPLNFLANSIGLVAGPWLARAGTDPAALRVEERRVLRVSVALCVAPLLLAVVGPPLIPLLLGAAYESSGTVFAVLALGAVIVTLNQPFAVILQNRGRPQAVAVGIAIGLGVGLVATYVLATLGGAVWAAVGYVVSQLVIFGFLGLAARRVRRDGVMAMPTAGASSEGSEQL